MFDWREHIVRDPSICGGLPVMRGTRVPLRSVLADLAHGRTTQEILGSYPTLKEEHLQAAISFAATSAAEDMPVPAVPGWLLASEA